MMNDWDFSWTSHRTPGGASVLARHVPNDVVTIDVWVATGSAREDETNNGISHFLEHMLFKGTSRFGVGELDRHIMQLGGVWNAATSMDFTHYYVTVAAPYFEQALDAIADMIQHAAIDPVEFEKERSVILEELRRKQDDPWGWLFDELYRVCYATSPYRRTVLGTFESISRLSREAMWEYYRRTYTADSVSVLVAGDVNPDRAIELATKYFSDLGPAENPWPAPDPTTHYERGVRQVVARDVNETYLALAYPAPGMDNLRDVVAMDVLSTVVGSGRSSRLHQRLREQLQLVEDIGAGYPTHRFPALFYIYACLQAPHLEAAIEEAERVVRAVVHEAPSDSELAKAKRRLRHDLYFGTETNSGQTGLMGYYLTLTGSLDVAERYLWQLEQTSVEDLVGVAQRYLSQHEPVVLAAVPAGARASQGVSA